MSLQCSVQEVATYIWSREHVVPFTRSPNWQTDLPVVGACTVDVPLIDIIIVRSILLCRLVLYSHVEDACVGINSVRREISSSVIIVFYDRVRGRNKGDFFWSVGDFSFEKYTIRHIFTRQYNGLHLYDRIISPRGKFCVCKTSLTPPH